MQLIFRDMLLLYPQNGIREAGKQTPYSSIRPNCYIGKGWPSAADAARLGVVVRNRVAIVFYLCKLQFNLNVMTNQSAA